MIDIIITGVGGQGTVSLGHLISMTLTDLSIPFVAAETHGMSQRGGSVIFHLRIGKDKHSPLIEKQKADLIIAGEPMEALRAIPYLKPDGIILSDRRGILSPVARQMGFEYPDLDEILERIKQYTSNLFLVDATREAIDLGSEKIANIVLLGALMELNLLEVPDAEIKGKIKERWPKFVELNMSAIERGNNLVKGKIEIRN